MSERLPSDDEPRWRRLRRCNSSRAERCAVSSSSRSSCGWTPDRLRLSTTQVMLITTAATTTVTSMITAPRAESAMLVVRRDVGFPIPCERKRRRSAALHLHANTRIGCGRRGGGFATAAVGRHCSHDRSATESEESHQCPHSPSRHPAGGCGGLGRSGCRGSSRRLPVPASSLSSQRRNLRRMLGSGRGPGLRRRDAVRAGRDVRAVLDQLGLSGRGRRGRPHRHGIPARGMRPGPHVPPGMRRQCGLRRIPEGGSLRRRRLLRVPAGRPMRSVLSRSSLLPRGPCAVRAVPEQRPVPGRPGVLRDGWNLRASLP